MKTDFNVVLLHDKMVDKQGTLVTTSLTMIDVHDFARSTRTFGVTQTFVAHPSPVLRKLARTLKEHWQEGFGSTYNVNRKDALSPLSIVSDLDEAIALIDERTGKLPKLVATSARKGPGRISYTKMKEILAEDDTPYLLMFGTGWGMSDQLLERADLFLEPVLGPGEYNHLSVRSACAIILDRLFGS